MENPKPTPPAKPVAPTKSAAAPQEEGRAGSVFASIVIPVALLVAVLIYMFVLGSPSNFQGGDPTKHPLPGNTLGIIYKGGYIVPILLGLLIMIITFSIERLLTLNRAKGV